MSWWDTFTPPDPNPTRDGHDRHIAVTIPSDDRNPREVCLTAMTCPRCDGELASRTLHELGFIHDAHECVGCHGLWVGPKQIDEISMTVSPRWIEMRHVPDAAAQQAPMTCPACAGAVVMQKILSRRDARVVMDVCPGCKHVWLDRGEREAIEQESILRDVFVSGSRSPS